MKRNFFGINLLVHWIVGNLDSSRIGTRRLKEFNLDHLTILNDIVNQYDHHVSTPNILTEVSNFIGPGFQKLCKNGAKTLGLYIESLKEIYVPSKKVLSEPFYQSLGLADSSMIELAKNGNYVITADGQLYGRMAHLRVDVDNFWHLTAKY